MVGIGVLTRILSDLSGLDYSWCLCDRAGGLAKDSKIYIGNLSDLSVEKNEDVSGRGQSPAASPSVMIVFK